MGAGLSPPLQEGALLTCPGRCSLMLLHQQAGQAALPTWLWVIRLLGGVTSWESRLGYELQKLEVGLPQKESGASSSPTTPQACL